MTAPSIAATPAARPGTAVTVSVVIPTRDRPAYLSQAVSSVRAAAAAARGLCTVEVVVVNDGSSHDTDELDGQPDVLVLHNSGARGPSGARNLGVARSSGELIAFLDDDDILLPGHLLTHVGAHLRDPGVGVTYSQGRLATSDLQPVFEPFPRGPLPAGDVRSFVFDGRITQLNTMVLKREVFDLVGGLDEDLRYMEDVDLIERLALTVRFLGLDEVTTLWRQHTDRRVVDYRCWRDRYRQSAVVRRRTADRARPLEDSLPTRTRRLVHARGWAALTAVRDAQSCLRAGQRGEAAKLLGAALRVSPPHALLRLPGFWGGVRSLLRP